MLRPASKRRLEKSSGVQDKSLAAKQACVECRRRKSKCNRALPACVQCSRYSRDCLYETGWKSPLTRRHLTEVENELARLKASFQQFDSQCDTTEYLPPSLYDTPRFHSSNRALLEFESNESDISMVSSRYPSSASQQPLPMPLPSSNSATQVPISTPIQTNARVDSNTSNSVPSAVLRKSEDFSSYSGKSSVRHVELAPGQGLFEWDERIGDTGQDGCTDGMAILTSDSDMGGYLGVTSGAALLRLTETKSPKVFTARRNNTPTPLLHLISSPVQLAGYVDAYFQTYHQCYPMIHEPTFRAQLMDVIPRPSHQAWQVLLYVIAALGAFSSSIESTDIDLALFSEAEKRFSVDMLQTGNILLVQATALMANYLQKRNKPNSGYNYLGLARRMAMGIGLHKELNHSNASLLKLEEKRRTWWCLFVFDSGAAITFSRPMDFPAGGIEVNMPMNVHDSDLTAATSYTSTTDQTTIYSHLRAQSAFHLVVSPIYSRIISMPFPSSGELIGLDDSCLGEWLASIPGFFSNAAIQHAKFVLGHSILSWRYRNFRILMYRPFVIQRVILESRVPSTAEEEIEIEDHERSMTDMAVQRCSSAAAETIDQITSFWSHPERRNMLACWYALYFLFQAVMIPVICLRNDPQAEAASGWRDQIRRTILAIRDMVPLSAAAKKCLSVIDTPCGELLLRDDDLQFQEPTEESPQTQLDNLSSWLWTPISADSFCGDAILYNSLP